MSHLSLSDTVLVSQDIAPVSSGGGVNSAAVVDMQGWDGCLFVFNIGAMGGNATFDARIMSSANSNFSGNSNVANAALTQVANGGNSNVLLIDVWRPSDRYLKSVTTPANGANTVVGSTAIRYRRTGVLPPTQVASQVVKVAAN